jgi:acyl carrier protein
LVWEFRHRVSDEFGVPIDEVKLDEELRGDSLEEVEFIMAIEERTGISIPDDVAASFRTLRDVIEFVRRRQEER